MAFTPNPEISYRIIVKHTRKCLEARNGSTNRGEPILQATVRADATSQLFKFRQLTPRHYAITCVKSDKNLDVEGNSKENNARLIQWDRSDGEWNEHFRFVRVGEDSYYIIARHSDKCLAVLNGSKEDGGELVHTRIAAADYYYFQFVPADVSAAQISNRDYSADPSATVRKVVLAVIKLVPSVGGVLSPVTDYFWPSGAEQWMWNQVREYAISIARELISKERLRNLRAKIDGIGANLKEYNQEPYGSELKGGMLSAMLVALTGLEAEFFDQDKPEQTLPYFVAFGTLRLAVLRESVVAYQKVFKKPDDRAAARLEDFKARIERFREGAHRARERALEWRLSQIVFEHNKSTNLSSRGTNTINKWWVRDKYDDSSQSWYHSSLDGGDSKGESLARQAEADRKEGVSSSFGAWLDYFLGPAKLWRYLDPTVTDRPKRVEKSMQTGPVGDVREKPFRDDPRGRPITKIEIHTSGGKRLDGIEVFYGQVSAGLHGKRGTVVHTLALEAGESIVGVWGRSGEYLSALYFQTSKGRSVGGGPEGGKEWIAEPPDELNASLAFIGGRKSAVHIDALWFNWRYSTEE